MHILITAGPTREYIDTVRFISNNSSGLTGFLSAIAAGERGHQVTLITGPTPSPPPPGRNVKVIRVVSALEMHEQTMKLFPKVDGVVMTAAVGDYRPVAVAGHKLKKTGEPQILELVPNPDILAELGQRKAPDQVLIGFALEDRAARTNAQRKFTNKNLDAIILNPPSALAEKTNQVWILTEQGWEQWPRISKIILGKKIIRLLENLYKQKTCKNSNS